VVPDKIRMTPSTKVCIINYNTRDHLRGCLDRLRGESPGDLMVVDNASPDQSAEMVRREFPGVRLIANSENLGFAAAANQAIYGCDSTYLLLLNSDTRVEPGSLQALAGYLAQNPRAAVVGPRLLNPDGTLQRSCRRFPGSFSWLLDNRVLGKLARRLGAAPKSMLHVWEHDSARRVPWVVGAALALRVDAVREVGGFDSGYFLYCEEIDLCKRLWAAGWEVHFTPATEIAHVGGASTPGDRRSLDRHMIASTLRFYGLHYGKLRVWLLRMLLRAKFALAGPRAAKKPAPSFTGEGRPTAPTTCVPRTSSR
jgi:GT2 family glycosyltransferase